MLLLRYADKEIPSYFLFSMSAAVNVTNGGSATTPSTNLPGNGRATASLLLDDRLGHTREVGNQATWSLSSCKPGKMSRKEVS